MNDKKILGLNINIALGLSWLILPFGIVALAVDHEKMDEKEKQTWVSTYVVEGALITYNSIVSSLALISSFFSLLWLICIPVIVFLVIAIVKAFKGEDYEFPIAYSFAGVILGYNKKNSDKENKKTEEVQEIELGDPEEENKEEENNKD